VSRNISEEETRKLYKRINKRRAAVYFFLLVSIQIIGIYTILEFNLKANVFIFVSLSVFLATVLPVILAIAIFRWPWVEDDEL